VLVARDGGDVARHVENLCPEAAREIGDAARERVLEQHTYEQRAEQVEQILSEELAGAVR
jgi:spore maturation protein CgeB